MPSTCPAGRLTWIRTIRNNTEHLQRTENVSRQQTSKKAADTEYKMNCQSIFAGKRCSSLEKFRKYSGSQSEWIKENTTPLCYSSHGSCDVRKASMHKAVKDQRTEKSLPFWLAPQKDAHTYEQKSRRNMRVQNTTLADSESFTNQRQSLPAVSLDSHCNLPLSRRESSGQTQMYSREAPHFPVHVDALMFTARDTNNLASINAQGSLQVTCNELKPIRAPCHGHSHPQETFMDDFSMANLLRKRSSRNSCQLKSHEEVNHTGSVPLSNSRSVFAIDAARFQGECKPQALPIDSRQTIGTHATSRKKSCRKFCHRQSYLAPCNHLFLEEEENMLPGFKGASPKKGCFQEVRLHITDDSRMFHNPAKGSLYTSASFSTTHTDELSPGYLQQLEAVKDTCERIAIPRTDVVAESKAKVTPRKKSSRRSQQRYSRPIYQIIREDSDAMKMAARKEAIQETQCFVEHQEGNKDGIKQEGAARVRDIYLSEDSSNVESATEEKRRSWQTKLRRWSSRSSRHAKKTNPWNDGLVSTSKLLPLRESENDVLENDPDIDELREHQSYFNRRDGVCTEVEKTMNLVKLNGTTMSLFDLRQDICNLVDCGVFKNIHKD